MRCSLLLVIAAVCTGLAVCMRIEFTQHPEDTETIIGQDAVFQCQFNFNTSSGIIAAIRWYINNASVIQNTNDTCQSMTTMPSTMIKTGNLRAVSSILKVTANNACHNETEVYCSGTLLRIMVMGNTSETERLAQEVSDSARLYVQNIGFIGNASLKVYTNGSIKAVWNSIVFSGSFQNISVKYHIAIISDISEHSISDCISSSCPESKTFSQDYTYGYGNQSQRHCETFMFRITPVISLDQMYDSFGNTTEVTQDLYTIDSIRSGGVTFIGSNSLEFVFVLDMPMPFCDITINATDYVSNISYHLSKTRQRSGATTKIPFRVENTELPFDRRYRASFILSNRHSMVTVTTPIRLSTYSVQSVSQESSRNQTVITFAQNTTARGAFIVCSNANSSVQDEFSYQYIIARKDNSPLALSEARANNSCNMQIYDIKSDGQLQDTQVLLPSYETIHQSCIVGCTSSTPNNNSGSQISATASPGDGYIIFVCNISDAEPDDLLGCISIIHNNYSSLVVNKIDRRRTTMNVSVESGKIYPFSILPWKRSGLFDSTVVINGTLSIPNRSHEMITTTDSEGDSETESDVPTSRPPPVPTSSPGSIIIIIIIVTTSLVFSVAIISITILLVRVVKKKRRSVMIKNAAKKPTPHDQQQ